MHSHLRTERKLEFYADKMCISTKYLSKSLKKETGKTGSLLLFEAVVVEAQALLKQNSLEIKQIADILTFPDPSAFGKFFKKHTGYSPATYRKTQL
ncbi:HTH-type transcriptional activator Btr [compost metagenome]